VSASDLPYLSFYDIKRIARVQALVRGWLARRVKVPARVSTHVAGIYVTEDLVSDFLEAQMIPDLLVELIKHNRITDNFGLYSDT
jgi:hypothetical protein